MMSKLTFGFSLLILLGLSLLIREMAQLEKEIQWAQHAAEVSDMRAGLIEEWVRRHLQHQEMDVNKLASTNPLNLLHRKPEDYQGAFRNQPENAVSGWYFDQRQGCLVYVFDDGEKIAYRLQPTSGASSASIGMIGGLDLMKDGACFSS